MRADAPPTTVADPHAILEVYLRCPEAHPYGIADVAQLWDRSRWWRAGEAVAGLLDLPGSAVPVLYAVAAGAAASTLDLLELLEPVLPGRLLATGPRGTAGRLRGTHRPVWVRDYVKMHLAEPGRLPPPDPAAVTLEPGDLADLEALFATDAVSGDFFHPGLLDTGLYVGRREAGALVAVAGIHVIDEEYGVAALGNIATHPDHRRRGLGRSLTATLCHRLLARVTTVGLNVREANEAARGLYAGLGFRTVLPYEEAELVRQRVSS
jgi:GNAT superfamily N-acetyltransferase